MYARGMPAPQDRLTGGSALSACVMVCLLALPAWAQKTDIVTLVNGDTLTCEIKLLDRGRLQVSTDHLGTVNIEWDKVTVGHGDATCSMSKPRSAFACSDSWRPPAPGSSR